MKSNVLSLEAAEQIIFSDLLGIRSDDFANAYLTLAFADVAGENVNPEQMRKVIAELLANQTGATASLILAQIKTPNDAKAIAVRNYLDLIWLLNTKIAQHNKKISSWQQAQIILATGPESPRFNDALQFGIVGGNDVPVEAQQELIALFDAAMKDAGVRVEGDEVNEEDLKSLEAQ